jgi:hypothetical protein
MSSKPVFYLPLIQYNMTFNDLIFSVEEDEEQAELNWVQLGETAFHIFPNHYGVSVVRGYGTKGVEKGLYELAVIHMGPDDEWSEIVYDTPITNDVIGYLTPDDITSIMQQVSELPPRNL